MKKLFNGIILMCIAALIVACGKEKLQQEDNGDKIQISLLFSIGNSPLSIGQPMTGTKGTAENLFDAIYEGIVSGEIIASYELTFKNINTGTSTTISGNWTDNKTISLEKGTYTIYGISAATGKGIYQTCSLSYQDEVTITPQTRSITIKAQYDCSLLILNDDSVDRILYYASQNDSTYFSQYHNLTYAFVKSAEDFTQGNKAFLKVYFKNGKSGIVDLGQINIQKGKYYLLENLNSYADASLVLDIDKMENGDYNSPITFAASGINNIGTFAVWSTKTINNDASNTPIVSFCGDYSNSIITYNENKMEPNHWTYNPYRYWDKTATYSFVAVAPNANIIKYNKPENVADNAGKFVSADASGYTLIGQNLQLNTAPAQDEIQSGFNADTDLMISDKVNINGANGATGDVNLQFKHILAKLNIAIAKDPTFDNVKVLVKSVKITGLDDTGTYAEPTSNTASGWTSSKVDENYKLLWENADGIELSKGTGEGETYQPGKKLYFIESLVMPQSIEANIEKLIVDYVIVSGSNSEYYNYTLNLNDGEYKIFNNFIDGYKYTIYLTVRPNVITFDATTENWVYRTQN